MFVYGGAAPYRLDNTQPGTIILTDRNQNPITEVGSPGNARPNAGRINSTAYFNADLQRNLQFAVKFSF